MAVCEVRKFLEPCLLLLLREQADHGYELAQRLPPLGIESSEPGTVYRVLRGLEAAGLVCSTWRPAPSGPARRIYQLTPAGEAALEDEVQTLVRTRATVDRFLRVYAQSRMAPARGLAAPHPVTGTA